MKLFQPSLIIEFHSPFALLDKPAVAPMGDGLSAVNHSLLLVGGAHPTNLAVAAATQDRWLEITND